MVLFQLYVFWYRLPKFTCHHFLNLGRQFCLRYLGYQPLKLTGCMLPVAFTASLSFLLAVLSLRNILHKALLHLLNGFCPDYLLSRFLWLTFLWIMVWLTLVSVQLVTIKNRKADIKNLFSPIGFISKQPDRCIIFCWIRFRTWQWCSVAFLVECFQKFSSVDRTD